MTLLSGFDGQGTIPSVPRHNRASDRTMRPQINADFAPIAVFVYKRPHHTARLIDSLLANPSVADSPVFVFCDGARTAEDREAVETTRRLVRERVGPYGEIIERTTNLGLASSIVGGVTELVMRYGRVIVLEDDLILHRGCIDFLNAALRHYADDERVYHVNAYRYPIPAAAAPSLSRLTSSWGWATWRRAWEAFEHDAAKLEQLIRAAGLASDMDFGGSFPFFAMLQQQVLGQIDSWAIRWYASVLLRKGLAVYPGVSQTVNGGMDSTGSHSPATSRYEVQLGTASQDWPAQVAEDPLTLRQLQAFLGGVSGSYPRRLARQLKRLLFKSRDA